MALPCRGGGLLDQPRGVGPDGGRVGCVASFACDLGSAAWNLFGTCRLARAVDLQAVYFDSGSFRGGDATALGTEFGCTFKLSGIGISAGYCWDVPPSWILSAPPGIRRRANAH